MGGSGGRQRESATNDCVGKQFTGLNSSNFKAVEGKLAEMTGGFVNFQSRAYVRFDLLVDVMAKANNINGPTMKAMNDIVKQ